MATLTTNAVPIAAGVVLFREDVPGGIQGALQIAAFAALVVSATLLNDPRATTQRTEPADASSESESPTAG